MSTIVALATHPGKCAIHIIRLSGNDAYKIINKCVKNTVEKTEDRVQINFFLKQNKQIIDQVVLIKFYQPNSYTGEDLIEINCHGNDLIVKMIIDELIASGAVLAKAGDFTKRALLNNKISLSQVENIQNLFDAKSHSEILGYSSAINSQNLQILKNAEQQLFKLCAESEINIDYPPDLEREHEIFLTNLKNKVNLVCNDLIELKKISLTKKPSNYRILLLGRPNAGKSSLLNYLLGEEKIIVSDIEGTTRDALEVDYFYNGYCLTLVDSAGLRETEDKLEQKGIDITKKEIEKADLIFLLISCEQINDFENQKIKDSLKDKNFIVVYTKKDLMPNFELSPKISVKDKDINELFSIIDKKLKQNYFPTGFTSQYTIGNIQNCIDNLLLCREDNITVDLLSEFISNARQYLLNSLELNENNFEKINKIFDNFCIGK